MRHSWKAFGILTISLFSFDECNELHHSKVYQADSTFSSYASIPTCLAYPLVLEPVSALFTSHKFVLYLIYTQEHSNQNIFLKKMSGNSMNRYQNGAIAKQLKSNLVYFSILYPFYFQKLFLTYNRWSVHPLHFSSSQVRTFSIPSKSYLS